MQQPTRPQPTRFYIKHFRTLANGLQLYTVQQEGHGASYAADFYSRMNQQAASDSRLAKQLRLFDSNLDRIALRNVSLLTLDCLRDEGKAHALPSEAEYLRYFKLPRNITLRLYCYPASSRTLILFNGDVKTTKYPKDCPQVGPHFRRAIRLARTLEEVQAEWTVSPDNKLHLDPPYFEIG